MAKQTIHDFINSVCVDDDNADWDKLQEKESELYDYLAKKLGKKGVAVLYDYTELQIFMESQCGK